MNYEDFEYDETLFNIKKRREAADTDPYKQVDEEKQRWERFSRYKLRQHLSDRMWCHYYQQQHIHTLAISGKTRSCCCGLKLPGDPGVDFTVALRSDNGFDDPDKRKPADSSATYNAEFFAREGHLDHETMQPESFFVAVLDDGSYHYFCIHCGVIALAEPGLHPEYSDDRINICAFKEAREAHVCMAAKEVN